MNEQAQKILSELLERALQGVDKAVEFSQAQIPDVVHQLLVWKFVYSSIRCATGVFLLTVGYFIIYKIYKFIEAKRKNLVEKALEDYQNGKVWTRFSPGSSITSLKYDSVVRDSGFGVVMFVVVVGVINFVISIALINLEWLKIWLTPKLYLLEYAASLVK